MPLSLTFKEDILNSENTRLPRGARPVAEAFLTALDTIPAKSRQDVAKAALGIVKEGVAQRKGAAQQEAATAKVSKIPITAKRAASAPVAKPATKGPAPKAKHATARKPQMAKPKLTVVRPAAAA